jgi:cephalosporin-C deacetylase
MWDLSWDELQTYGGRTPRPADLDQYWSAAIADLDDQPAEVQVEPAAVEYRSAHCFDLWFTGIGGARIHAKYLRPAVPDGHGRAIAMFHGYTWRAADWLELLPFAAEGFSVLALDCRGQGGQSEDIGGRYLSTFRGHIVRGLLEGPEHLYYRSVFADTVRTARVLMDLPDVDAARVGAHGGSQGGGLALACAALEPRVAAVMVFFPFLCDYQRVWEMDLAKDAYEELQEWFRRFDPNHARAVETFTRLGYIDVQHLADRIRGRVLMVTCLADQICPPSTQFAAYNRISAAKDVLVYPDYGHEDLPDLRDHTLAFFRAHL